MDEVFLSVPEGHVLCCMCDLVYRKDSQVGCPRCGSLMFVTNQTGFRCPRCRSRSASRQPGPGGFAICMVCFSLCRYRENGTIRRATNRERQEFMADPDNRSQFARLAGDLYKWGAKDRRERAGKSN